MVLKIRAAHESGSTFENDETFRSNLINSANKGFTGHWIFKVGEKEIKVGQFSLNFCLY
jgi:hypothetical protein